MSHRIPAPMADVVLLLARVAIGVVFAAHGWQKLTSMGLDATARAFRDLGVPAPTASAYYATFVELVGGVLLIVGALVTLTGLLLFVDMAGALVTVHIDKGMFVERGGYEYVLTLCAVTLLLATLGGGRLSIDGLLGCHSSGPDTTT